MEYEFKPKNVALGGALCTFGSGLYAFNKTIFPNMASEAIWTSIFLFFIGSFVLISGFIQLNIVRYKILPQWDWEIVHHHILSMENGDEIRIINTFIPDMDRLIPLLKDLFIKQRKIVSIKILLLDYEEAPILVDSRFKYRPESTGIAIESIKENIRQLKQLKQVAQENWNKNGFNGTVNIQVRLYSHIPIGAYYQIGEKFMELAFLYTTKSGTSGPALLCNNVNSKKWQSFAENFEDSWDNARPYSID